MLTLRSVRRATPAARAVAAVMAAHANQHGAETPSRSSLWTNPRTCVHRTQASTTLAMRCAAPRCDGLRRVGSACTSVSRRMRKS